MTSKILQRLKTIAREEKVRVLSAIESGSRAWGFASTDSDYDVRFIYVHQPNWYLSIAPKRDVIERPLEDELDISGWELTKALVLYRKSNPPLYEWLQSPIVYVKPQAPILQLRKLIPQYFCPKSCLMHYLSMARNNMADYAGKPKIKLKKYFYVLRPVFACAWIKKFGTMPPIEFERLLAEQSLSADLKRTIATLLENKRRGTEHDAQPRIALLDDFVAGQIEIFTRYAGTLGKRENLPYEPLDRLLRAAL